MLEKQIKTCLEKKVDKQDFKNFIKKKEGLPFLQATKIFKDEKYLTICYGHYGSDVLPNQKKTRQQCNQLLDEDVTVRLLAIQEARHQNRFVCILVSWRFIWQPKDHSTNESKQIFRSKPRVFKQS